MDQLMGNNATTSTASPISTITITVKFVVAGKADIKVEVPTASTIRALKAIIAEKSEIFPDKQVLLYNDNELCDGDARLADYGIIGDCQVMMSVNMSTGVSKKTGIPSSSIILYVPMDLSQDNDSLRSTVKNITIAKRQSDNRQKNMEKQLEKAQVWTPEKQLEIELTRNRMKALIRNKNKMKILSLYSSAEAPIDTDSVIGSRNLSPIQTPPNEPHSVITFSSNPLADTLISKEDHEVTEKELKLFFEPVETLSHLKRLQRQKSMVQPPQSLEELEELKKRLSTIGMTNCNTCRRKIPPTEQEMRCRCQKLFCRKHRDPQNHQCVIDYKQTGRKKINKWMPKIGDDGVRKGKI